MDKNIMRDLRKALFVGTIFSGAASLSRIFSETENELDDMVNYIDEKFKVQKLMKGNPFRKVK
jgi:hypothetical protein